MNKYINKRVEDYSWDFLCSNTREYTHSYHIYPAMMIPQIAVRIFHKKKRDAYFFASLSV